VSPGPSAPLVDSAPAKINLTLRVLGRRSDGYHEIESLVAFAEFGDRLSFLPGAELTLEISGPTAAKAGEIGSNLVLKAAREMAARRNGLKLGGFRLSKHLPVAAGLGGGSADAGAALRLIAQANRLTRADPQLYAAARATGADVAVCLESRPRIMRGVGDILSEPLTLPALPVLLVNPGIAVATKEVFAGWASTPASLPATDLATIANLSTHEKVVRFLLTQSNDLESPALALAPAIADVLLELRAAAGCDLARMSGSGATCFGLFTTKAAAVEAGRVLGSGHPHWWIQATTLGGSQTARLSPIRPLF
jgi:4-diphosphocytidyl-2-C-methyl-D-erythritol kinase